MHELSMKRQWVVRRTANCRSWSHNSAKRKAWCFSSTFCTVFCSNLNFPAEWYFMHKFAHEKAVGGMEDRKLQIEVAALFVNLKIVSGTIFRLMLSVVTQIPVQSADLSLVAGIPICISGVKRCHSKRFKRSYIFLAECYFMHESSMKRCWVSSCMNAVWVAADLPLQGCLLNGRDGNCF